MIEARHNERIGIGTLSVQSDNGGDNKNCKPRKMICKDCFMCLTLQQSAYHGIILNQDDMSFVSTGKKNI